MTTLLRIFGAVCLALVVPALARAQNVPVAGSGGQYGYFNLDTRQYFQISASAFSGFQVTGLGYRATTDTVYLNARTGITELRTVNPTTGTTTLVGGYDYGGGVATDTIGLTFNSSGTQYVYNFGNDAIFSVDSSTAVGTQIGNSLVTTAPPLAGKLAFNGATLYGTMSLTPSTANGLYSFNTTSGIATLVGSGTGGDAAIYSDLITFSNAGTLYGISGTTLYQISEANGGLTSLGPITGADLPSSFTAAVVAPVPEPTTTFGVAFAAVGFIQLVRRRVALGRGV